jgi:hypothetical protein
MYYVRIKKATIQSHYATIVPLENVVIANRPTLNLCVPEISVLLSKF